MSSYVPNTPDERREMLDEIDVADFRELFADVPESVYLRTPLRLPEGKSEWETRRTLESLAQKNRVFDVILRGAGAYDHYIPAIVRGVTSKEEFLTAYTPYQPEISQGILQSIFEYQTDLCELTGMDVSNASVYDGASAAAEAAAMCRERTRQTTLISGAAHPDTIATVQTYGMAADAPVSVVPVKDGQTDLAALAATLDSTVSAVCVQQPNFFGLLEDVTEIARLTHAAGAKLIVCVNPISLGLCKTPAEYGADIAVGEGQPLGLPLSFGGPYLGFMTTKKAMARKLPGRIVGETTDAHGRRMFVLTLQAREQHIRREKAGSNICSNEALCALTAGAYLAAMGAAGLERVARRCYENAHALADALCTIDGFRLLYDAPFFHEFVTATPVAPIALEKGLAARGILSGLPIDGGMLWCATEKLDRAGIDLVIAAVREVCQTCN